MDSDGYLDDDELDYDPIGPETHWTRIVVLVSLLLSLAMLSFMMGRYAEYLRTEAPPPVIRWDDECIEDCIRGGGVTGGSI